MRWIASRRLLGAPILSTLLLGALACDGPDRRSAILAPAGFGVIEGRITDPGGPVQASISIFEAITRQGAPSYQIRLETDSTGAFSVPVPYGAYFLRVTGPGSVEFSYGRDGPRGSPGESLRVAPGSERIRADFSLGALRLRVPVPSGWTGHEPAVVLERPVQEPLHGGAWTRSRVDQGLFQAELRGLPAGRYTARLYFPRNDEPPVYLPQGTNWVTADRIGVRAGEWTEAEYALSPPATLRGAVRGSWQETRRRLGVYDRPLVLLFSVDSTRVKQIYTEDAGDFLDQTFRQGIVRVGFSLSGMVRWSGGETFALATSYELRPGAEIFIPDWVESGVLFHLEGEDGRTPWARDFGLSVYDTGGVLLVRWAGGARTENLFAVSNLSPGEYLFHLVAGDRCEGPWVSTWYPGELRRELAVPIRIDEPGRLQERLWLVRLGAELGWALEGGEVSRAGSYAARLHAAADSTLVVCGATQWSAGEPASLGGLEAGTYALAASVYREGRWRRSWYPGVSRHGDATAIPVSEGSRVDLGAWRFPD